MFLKTKPVTNLVAEGKDWSVRAKSWSKIADKSADGWRLVDQYELASNFEEGQLKDRSDYAIKKFNSKISAQLVLLKPAILPYSKYCLLVWHFCEASDSRKIERLQERGLRNVHKDHHPATTQEGRGINTKEQIPVRCRHTNCVQLMQVIFLILIALLIL